MQLIEQGVPRHEARLKVEAEFASAADVGEGTGRAILSKVQEEEELQLQAALKTYTERHGHGPRVPRASGPRGQNSAWQQQQQQRRQTFQKDEKRSMPAPPIAILGNSS